jgi:hypothetical protein
MENYRYNCINCKKLIAASNRPLNIHHTCSACEVNWDRNQISFMNKKVDLDRKSNEDNKRKYARTKLRKERDEKNFC